MTYNYIIDSYAWIEYFKASKFGENAKKYIESKQAATQGGVLKFLYPPISVYIVPCFAAKLLRNE